MRLLSVAIYVFSVGTMVLRVGAASGQDYPIRPIRIVATEAGSAADFAARLIAQGISGPLGRQVIVDGRPAGAMAEIVSKAAPDGYTVLLSGSTMWTTPLLQSTSYDPVKDFSPITILASSPNILVVDPSLQAKSVKELIALAKSKPGELNYGSGPAGTSSQLAAELFKAMTGVNIVGVPYRSGGLAVTGLIGGQVQLTFAVAGSVSTHLKSGRLSALAVTTLQPSTLFPGVPTVAATVPGYESKSIYGMFAPAKTPAAIIARLNEEIVRVVNKADLKERFLGAGLEPIGSSAEQLLTAMKAEMVSLSKLIKEAGIRSE